ncbi:hypothetical protein K7X08_016623 [Anisodus acutangulus]|uniref:Uncharacterized protein n=1 Tax=Anisodus acutangulus TaxID=402998 RepID=A0A9Q1LHN6_9SOLA|nr:hypothetical protein K7X08_016623 [Anisodus acutangulus]
MIRGVSVDICAQKINNFYFRKEGEGDDDFSLKHMDYDERMKNPDDHIVWAASIIDKETPGVPQIDRIDRYIEPKQMVDYTRLEYVSASFPASTSVPEVPAQTTKIVPATSEATSSAPAVGPGVPAYGMRLIRLDEAKVTKWDEEFPSYVKEAIETDLVPQKENLEVVREEQKSIKEHLQAIELRLGILRDVPSVSTEPCIDHSTARDDMEDDDNRSERQSESEPDSDEGDNPLASARRAWDTSGASSYSTPPIYIPLPSSVGHVIPLDTNAKAALVP